MKHSTRHGAELARIALFVQMHQLIVRGLDTVRSLNEEVEWRIHLRRASSSIEAAVHVLLDDALSRESFKHTTSFPVHLFGSDRDPPAPPPPIDTYTSTAERRLDRVLQSSPRRAPTEPGPSRCLSQPRRPAPCRKCLLS